MSKTRLPGIALLQIEYVLHFFERDHFDRWPQNIETVTFRWEDEGASFIDEVRRKGIDIVIGNIPATAYNRFCEIAQEFPEVRFIPAVNVQALNRSKEDVTEFCCKHGLATPQTWIFHDRDKAEAFLQEASYPKILKRSYGPSNYGGYHTYRVASKDEALKTADEEQLMPLYVQEAINLKQETEYRVILSGHTPVAHYWHYEGKIPDALLQEPVEHEAVALAMAASKAAGAEYFVCDLAIDEATGKAYILECSMSFPAPSELRRKIADELSESLLSGIEADA
jgi:glutathione synthase/RimK-type ligase-like ATP-grasp enzyme